MMNIISYFPFAEEYELETLLLRFVVEDKGVAEWVICENDYTFTGEFKGFHLQEWLDADRRFDPFRHKITIISKSKDKGAGNPMTEDEWFACIGNIQRDFGTQYILDKYPDDGTWVIHSDVDEMHDFQGNERTEIIFDSLKKHPSKTLWFPIRRYIYDFDNYAFTYHFHVIIPLNLIRSYGKMMGSVSPQNSMKLLDPSKGEFAAFEYSFCFKPEHISRKIDIWNHRGYTQADIDLALKCNKKVQRSGQNEVSPRYPNSREPNNHWFEKVEINEQNSPLYVVNNIDWLRTNSVDPDYKENRKLHFREFFL